MFYCCFQRVLQDCQCYFCVGQQEVNFCCLRYIYYFFVVVVFVFCLLLFFILKLCCFCLVFVLVLLCFSFLVFLLLVLVCYFLMVDVDRQWFMLLKNLVGCQCILLIVRLLDWKWLILNGLNCFVVFLLKVVIGICKLQSLFFLQDIMYLFFVRFFRLLGEMMYIFCLCLLMLSEEFEFMLDLGVCCRKFMLVDLVCVLVKVCSILIFLLISLVFFNVVVWVFILKKSFVQVLLIIILYSLLEIVWKLVQVCVVGMKNI